MRSEEVPRVHPIRGVWFGFPAVCSSPVFLHTPHGSDLCTSAPIPPLSTPIDRRLWPRLKTAVVLPTDRTAGRPSPSPNAGTALQNGRLRIRHRSWRYIHRRLRFQAGRHDTGTEGAFAFNFGVFNTALMKEDEDSAFKRKMSAKCWIGKTSKLKALSLSSSSMLC